MVMTPINVASFIFSDILRAFFLSDLTITFLRGIHSGYSLGAERKSRGRFGVGDSTDRAIEK